MEQFKVEDVMESIRTDIKDRGLCTSELRYVSGYHNRMITKLKAKKELIIFGAGDYGRMAVEDLEQHGITSIQCICDNNGKMAGKKVEGYLVLTPEEAWKRYPGACFVITPKEYENEILSQLIHMGVPIDNILLFNIKLTGLEIV